MPGLVPAQPLRHASGRGLAAAGAERKATGSGVLDAMLPRALSWLCVWRGPALL
jgi:hypothetical protein